MIDAAKKSLLVTGDVTIRHEIYSKEYGPMGLQIETIENIGGAGLLYGILTAVSAKMEANKGFTVKCADEKTAQLLPPKFHTYHLWRAFPKETTSKETVWREDRFLGSGGGEGAFPSEIYKRDIDADLLVIDDLGQGFRHSHDARRHWPWQIVKESREPEWIILRMEAPICHGDLWLTLSKEFQNKLIVVVAIDDLRMEEIGITQGLSWERTATEIATELICNVAVSGLLSCRHLIVTIGHEGALWFDNSEKEPLATLIFDPVQLEGEVNYNMAGSIPGEELCVTAGVTTHLALQNSTSPIIAGVISGLASCRFLRSMGYGKVGKEKPGFPYTDLAELMTGPPAGFSKVAIPLEEIKSGKRWSILGGEAKGGGSPLFGIARRVAIVGSRALGSIPFGCFGKLLTVDRGEIESLRGIRHLMLGYANKKKPPRPLSIAAFGAPGSGKSFGIKQIAKGVLGANAPILEFNLSQFSHPEELIGAFHQVRDRVLEGEVPVVFWDEFDSKEYQWLQYLLAPMQDGRFQEGQLTHPIGKCIFVFAGGTSYTMENFTPPEADREKTARFRLVKGPDFISRLNGYLNVLGPNRRQFFDYATSAWIDDQNEPDFCFPIRRALLIRSILGLGDAQQLEMDKGILTALLEIDRYRHGARSLETILNLCRRPDSTVIRRSDIPPAEQVTLHIDYDRFMELIRRDLPFRVNAKKLAPAVHDYYRQLCKKNGWPVQYDNDYNDLPPDIRADNTAAAMRIPEVLSQAGLRVEENASASNVGEVRAVIESQMEALAEAEHIGWMEEKLKCGWAYGPIRDDARKIHPALISYAALSEADKEKDRNAVRSYPEIVNLAGYAIVKCR